MKKRKLIHDNWKTPDSFLQKIYEEFGIFFDPCPLNSVFDGLNCEWGEVNYINPPYSQKLKEAFIKKALEVSRGGATCIMLLPVSTSTKVFHEVIKPNAKEIRFIKGRIKFEGINSNGNFTNTTTGMHDSMLVIFKETK